MSRIVIIINNHISPKVFTQVKMKIYYLISFLEFKSMKMSFSCSSLQRSSENLESSELATRKVNRPYNSLTKKR